MSSCSSISPVTPRFRCKRFKWSSKLSTQYVCILTTFRLHQRRPLSVLMPMIVPNNAACRACEPQLDVRSGSQQPKAKLQDTAKQRSSHRDWMTGVCTQKARKRNLDLENANRKHVSLASPDSDSYLLKQNLTIESEHEPCCTASHRGGFGEDIPRSLLVLGPRRQNEEIRTPKDVTNIESMTRRRVSH